ncbi:peptide chain release factor N(5)-glutamine methyltransferase [Nocardioides marmoribigeumensis]|uniref:Release factor glutamine methyltransferase n=1 Tax=Nocardioides marmoribigeumensis TaxID=433649 RepID=A0ABU2BYX9_9ACTN|nr:peptide chain release factor N(5)-glutamine methyltransferase [Nocardioides marmoribigeumensis]MDR7363604.1 release factor glutamine methyltransferase [Nocardioides marmoribigeumensis]
MRRLLDGAASRLRDAGVDSPEHDAAELLAHVLGVRRGSLVTAPEPDADQLEAFDALLERRAARVPLQHLTGSAGFRYVELQVGAGVFVPRPETEVVAGFAVERVREALQRRPDPVVVDLCTGSGAIALAVATEVPESRVHAVELDPGAVEWASRNLEGSGVDLRSGDMAEAFPELDGTVDVVVSNPPYIPLEAWESVTAEVRDHDPALALWSGQDGLDAMRVVEATAARLLRPGGVVAVEHADVQGEAAPAVFRATGRWREVADRPDLAGRPRFVTAVRAS